MLGIAPLLMIPGKVIMFQPTSLCDSEELEHWPFTNKIEEFHYLTTTMIISACTGGTEITRHFDTVRN